MSVFAEQALADVQTNGDTRGVALDDVGISDLRYPASVVLADGTRQHTICEAQLAVSLAADVRGTHMSRFVELLHDSHHAVSPAGVLVMAEQLATRLDAAEASVDLAFPLFVAREAPVSGQTALLGIDCRLVARAGAAGGQLCIGARVPVTSLCPCSKEISDYSAHSQRGYVKITTLDSRWIVGTPGLWPQELLEICDQAASAPVYPVLKRPDERRVTMLAYDKPAFVEDLARDISLELKGDERIAGFELEVVNHESIHDHQAFARLRWERP
jgi:GTP cyclohydrolase IB